MKNKNGTVSKRWLNKMHKKYEDVSSDLCASAQYCVAPVVAVMEYDGCRWNYVMDYVVCLDWSTIEDLLGKEDYTDDEAFELALEIGQENGIFDDDEIFGD